MLSKLHSQSGESLAEVLVSVLIAALGLLLLASMISSSGKIIRKSEDNEITLNTITSTLDSELSSRSGGDPGEVYIRSASGGDIDFDGSSPTKVTVYKISAPDDTPELYAYYVPDK
jgi:hypothetical protein